MTNPEAIEILKKDGWGYPENMHTEAVMMAIDALEYRTAKTPQYIRVYGKRLTNEARCIECGATVYRNQKYCSECGQAIDWSEVE